METINKTMITVTATINAPVEKVWNSWTAPDHITKWCQANNEWHAPFAENDLREGGRFKTTMAAKDGSFSFDFGGVYTKVEEFKTIEYTMDDNRKCIVHFSDNGNSTSIEESFEPEEMNTIELQRGGWQAILDSFKKYTESL